MLNISKDATMYELAIGKVNDNMMKLVDKKININAVEQM